MTSRPAGPYTLEFPYVVDSLSHSMEFNVDTLGTPITGTSPDLVEMRSKGSGDIPLDDAANSLWNVVRGLFNNTVKASTYTLWKRNPDNQERLFISAGLLSAPDGASSNPTVLASQVVMTFRSGGGHVLKLVALESTFATNPSIPLGSTGITVIDALSSFILDSDSIVLARDRAFAVAGMKLNIGQNEKVFRRRFRS